MRHNGDLKIGKAADAEKYAGVTEVTGNLSIYGSAKLDAPKLYPGGFDNFTILDGIGCVVLSSKQANGVTVLSCRDSTIRDQKIVGDKFYVAQSGGYNAHGNTVAMAVQELAFKTGERDVGQYRNMPLDTQKTPQEWAIVYRTVTGACRFGTEDFMKRKGALKKSYTLADILQETDGAYGYEQFRAVVTGATNGF